MMRLGEWGCVGVTGTCCHFGGTLKQLPVRTKPVKRKHTQEDKKAGRKKLEAFGGHRSDVSGNFNCIVIWPRLLLKEDRIRLVEGLSSVNPKLIKVLSDSLSTLAT